MTLPPPALASGEPHTGCNKVCYNCWSKGAFNLLLLDHADQCVIQNPGVIDQHIQLTSLGKQPLESLFDRLRLSTSKQSGKQDTPKSACIASATLAISISSRPFSHRAAPCAANCRAIAKPIPRPAPVISTFLPCSNPLIRVQHHFFQDLASLGDRTHVNDVIGIHKMP